MSVFPVPTPKKSELTKRLRALVQNAGVDKGSGEIFPSDSDGSSDSSSSDSNRNKEILSNEKIFKKLLNNPAARSNLSSIHAARAHKYGLVQFGPKNWYKESVNISKKLTAQEDRRKFRQGLKCDVDFLNHLNLHDLMKSLLDGEQKIDELPKTVKEKLVDRFECLNKVPIIDTLKLINADKAKKLVSSVEKIVALTHVSQSMGSYFARDDALDPALSTVCQALRGNTDFEFILKKRGGTFQSLAAAFYHLKSNEDRDLTGSTPPSSQGQYSYPRSRFRPLSGTCWYFQKHGRCSRRDCKFTHKCARCGKKSHGETTCRSRRGGGRN